MSRGLLSSRAAWNASLNRLTIARQARSEAALPLLDLTESNPTNAGLIYEPDQLSDLLGRATTSGYTPEPRGLRSTREALAQRWTSDEGDEVHPDDIFLTASTSEAYSFLFKLLADSGDSVLTATPSYPLLAHITSLESVALDTFAMSLHSGRRPWELELDAIEAATHARSRAIVVVHPNNPTGNYLSRDEQEGVAAHALKHSMAVISDEVFYDFRLSSSPEHAGPAARIESGLTFSLGGLSKSAALPHWKLGWIRLGGDARDRREAAAGLELICDTFLSVATPVQQALPEILALAPSMRSRIMARLHKNLGEARKAFEPHPAIELLEPEGGWSLVLRVPRIIGDEELAIELLDKCGVLVQPGYFFDFAKDGFFVLSLLTPEENFAEGVSRIAEYLGQRF